MSVRWLLSAAWLIGCDDGGPAPEPPAPAPRCAAVVLSVDDAVLARCPDGARFSWRIGEGALIDEATVGLRIAGEDALAPQWPQVAWRVDGATAVVTHSGRAGLPDLEVRLTLEARRLVVEQRFTATEPIVVEALIGLTGSLIRPADDRVLDAGARVALEEAAPAEGFRVWLGEPPLTAVVERPARITADGRVTHGPIGELAPDARFSLRSTWTVDDPGAALRDHAADRPSIGWGWRTGASHGAVVDPVALAEEAAALRAIGPDPWLVIDGLWAPAQGDWIPPLAVLDAIAPTRVGVFWPAALVCPDAPLHVEAPALHQPAEGACGRLDLGLPDSRAALERAAIALVDAGVAGVWLDDAGLAFLAALVDVTTFEAAQAPAAFDRLMGPPGAGCAADALNGPFPRTPACTAALSTLDAPATPAPVDPLNSMSTLLAHLDLPRVTAGPLVLSGPPAAARQRLAIALLGGGPRLLADAPSTLSPAAVDWLRATAELDLRRLAPVLDAAEWPPTRWTGTAGLVVFNWGTTPRLEPVPAALRGASDLFTGEAIGEQVEIAPGDARIILAE